jgi:two-component system, NtrC family, response regulator AtoC
MPKLHGLDLCRRLTRRHPQLPVIVITAFGTIDSAVAAMKAGAYDFLTKPFDIEALGQLLRRALDRGAPAPAKGECESRPEVGAGYGQLLGNSPAMLDVYDIIERVADSAAPVLITGESGTGKELVAREIHRRGARARGEFVAVNCAALPEALLESELFGHVRGAFTDAKLSRDGLFVRAHRGTLFLDEIGDMPIGLQPKLLRALQEGTIRPLGSSGEVRVDARLITATNRDLEGAIAQKAFREDLYYRINVVPIGMPPLRERGQDILSLAHALLTQVASKSGKGIPRLSPAACQKLLRYDWRGNVRELRNCIERAVALARGPIIDISDLPPRIRDHPGAPVALEVTDLSQILPLDQVERAYILRVLELFRGNKSLAAKVLGLSRKTLHRKVQIFGSASPRPSQLDVDSPRIAQIA